MHKIQKDLHISSAAALPSIGPSSQKLSLGQSTFTNSLGKFARRQKANGDPKRLCQQFLQFPQVEQSGTRKWGHEQTQNGTFLPRPVEHCRQYPGISSFVVARQPFDR